MFSKTEFTKKRFWVVFIGISICAILLRFWQLQNVPDGFHVDEAYVGYNAYSLMKTGRDESGVFMPLTSRGLNDFGGTVGSYIAIPFISVFGLNEWSVRAPTALFGILFIFLTYAFVYRLSGNRALALVSMALAAVSPVGIVLSRAQSVLIGFDIFYAAVYCCFLWIEKRTFWSLCLCIVGIIVSFFTYTGIRLFSLPLLFLIGAWYWRTFDKQSKIVFSAFFLFVCLLVAWLYFSAAGTRFSQISVFSTMNVQLPLDEEIREDGALHLPILMTRVIHNKVTAYAGFLLRNFTDYLSFQFLFSEAIQPKREQIPNMGVLLLIECPFLLIGIYTAIRKKLRYGIFCIVWFLLVPAIMSIASEETPNIHRFFLAMLPVHALVALGIITGGQYIRTRNRTAFFLGIIILFILNVFYFMHELFVHQPVHEPLYRNAEDKKLALYLKPIASSYDVIVSPKILEYILFFWPVEPAVYQREGSPRDTDNAWYRNFLFVNDNCPSLRLNPAVAAITSTKVLYIDRPVCPLAKDDVKIATIKYQHTLDAYYLIEKRTQ